MARTQGLADAPWQRVPWRALLPEALKALPALVILVSLVHEGNFGWFFWVVIIFWPYYVLQVIFRARTLTFRVTDTVVECRSRFLVVDHQKFRLSKVRSVNVAQPFLLRIFGLAKLRLITGGGVDSWIFVEGLTTATAKEFQRIIENHPARSSRTTVPAKVQAPPTTGDTINHSGDHVVDNPSGDTSLVASHAPTRSEDDKKLAQLDGSWLWRSAFSGFGLLWVIIGVFSILSAITQFLTDSMTDSVFGWLGRQTSEHFDTGDIASVTHSIDTIRAGDFDLLAPLIGLALALALLVYVLGLPLNVLRYWIEHHGFTLVRKNEDTLQVSEGLFNTAVTTVDAHLMRGVSVSDSLGGRLVGVQSMKAQIVGSTDVALLPAAPKAVVARTADMVLDTPGLVSQELRMLGPRALVRRLIGCLTSPLWIVAVVAVTTLFLPYGISWPLLGVGYVVLLVLKLAAAIPQHRNDRYVVADGWFLRQKGWFWRTRSITPVPRIAEWRWERSLIDQLAGVGTLTIYDGTGSRKLRNVTPQMATEFIRGIPGAGRDLRIELT